MSPSTLRFLYNPVSGRQPHELDHLIPRIATYNSRAERFVRTEEQCGSDLTRGETSLFRRTKA